MAGVRGKSGRKSALAEWNAARNVVAADDFLSKSWEMLNAKILEAGYAFLKAEPGDEGVDADVVWVEGLHRILQTDECRSNKETRYQYKKYSHLRRLYYELVHVAQNLITKAMPSRLEHGLPEDMGVEQFMLSMVRRTSAAKSHKKNADKPSTESKRSRSSRVVDRGEVESSFF